MGCVCGVDHDSGDTRPPPRNTVRLLLLGAGESGKSTIIKQMKILHTSGFTTDERIAKIRDIHRNVYDAIVTITTAMSKLEVELADAGLEDARRYVVDAACRADFTYPYPREFWENTQVLWGDAGVQACYHLSNQYQLIDCAKYFLDRVAQVAKHDYEPSDQDMLRCRVVTTGISETRFQINHLQFHMFDVGGQKVEREKWFQAFKDVTAIIFITSCSDYDLTLREDPQKNRLEESLELFRDIWSNIWLKRTSVILFLNKQDLLAEKVMAGSSKLEDFFPDFSYYIPPPSKNKGKQAVGEDARVTRVKYFIQDQFLKIVSGSRRGTGTGKREHCCYPHFTCAVDTENIRRVFSDCRDIIQRNILQEMDVL